MLRLVLLKVTYDRKMKQCLLRLEKVRQAGGHYNLQTFGKLLEKHW